jgi:hyperpolarization activated cyclic nucleotide-gated potassium channel 2
MSIYHLFYKVESCEVSVFKPDQVVRVVWDLFTMLFIFHEILLLPVDLSFSLESDYLTYMNYVTIAVFSTDIIINFNTAYQYKGAYVLGRKQIALNYFKLWFWIDLGIYLYLNLQAHPSHLT